MVPGLAALVRRIEIGDLTEADVYALERRHATAMTSVRPGAFLCPICGQSATRFLPFGLAHRRNACCPTCGSLERHRLLWCVLMERTDLVRRAHRVLHTAPEPCLRDRLRDRLRGRLRGGPGLRYTSVDRYDPAADIRSSLTDLPLATASQDVVLTSNVL